MHDDDTTIGHVLSRREVVAMLGAAGAGALVSCGRAPASAQYARSVLPACVVRPEQMEGPYFLDKMLERSDIRSEPSTGALRVGVPLDLAVAVSQVGRGGCSPLAGAIVDIWQCDALGIYSGVKDLDGHFDTTGQNFLRGYQVTGSDGIARFTTIYPGWYEGRTIHVHFKIRVPGNGASGHEFTSQFYFSDAQSNAQFTKAPYRDNTQRRALNAADEIFRTGGRDLLLALTDTKDGLAGTFDVGLQMG
ncbi:MAG: intradiol ring-cleavage dioxygenase [Gemmatimonadales bacterium]|nr:intradiol ring-cleavage dioxygenase [Gemmatimonadales bacterium]